MIFRILILSFLFLFSNSFSQSISSVNKKISIFKKTNLLKHAQWSITAKYVDNKKYIINYNSDESLSPASNLKLVTSFCALDLLGSEYKYKTGIYYSGEITDSVLNGNIIIIGDGDPTLGSDLIKGNPSLDSLMILILQSVKEKNIKKITGNILIDVSKYYGPLIPGKWNWEDIGNYYGTLTSAFSFHENMYKIFFDLKNGVGQKALISSLYPSIKNMEFENNILGGVVGSGDNGYVFNSPYSYKSILRGTIGIDKKDFFLKAAMPDPPKQFGEFLIQFLYQNNIEVLGNTKTINTKIEFEKNKLLLSISSPSLKEIVFIVNKKSNNFYSEMLLKEIGKKYDSDGGNFYKGLDAIKYILAQKGINLEGVNLYDGSGLTRHNIITTNVITEILIQATKENFFEDYYNSFPIAGNSEDISSLKNWGKGTEIENNARIKTGYVSGVRSHSGFVKDRKGRMIALSIIANNYNGETSDVTEIHKQIIIELAKLK